MGSVNKVFLIGNLGADPEIRYTQNQTAVANLRIATNERWTTAEGEQREHTEWHRIVAWGRLAEICSEYLVKGRQVFVEGVLRTKSWEDKEGNQRYTTEIRANNIQMLGRKDEEAAPLPEDTEFTDDDIPF